MRGTFVTPHTEHAKAGNALAVFDVFRFFDEGAVTGSDDSLTCDTGSSTIGGGVGMCTTGGVGVMVGGGGIMGSFRFLGGRLGFEEVKVEADGFMLFIE